jgi:hypothetical protein
MNVSELHKRQRSIAPFPLAVRWVGVFPSVVEIALPAMFHTRENLPLGGIVAAKLIRDHDPQDIGQALQQLVEVFLRRLLVLLALHEDDEHVAVLFDRPPR